MKLERIKFDNYLRGARAAGDHLNKNPSSQLKLSGKNEFSRGFNNVINRIMGIPAVSSEWYDTSFYANVGQV